MSSQKYSFTDTFRSSHICRHTQAHRFVRDKHTRSGEKMIGTQLRELFGEDIACTIEDFLYTRHYWSLETCLLEDDYDGVWDFLTREQTFSLRHLHVRLLYYTRSVLMLNLLLDSLNLTFSKNK